MLDGAIGCSINESLVLIGFELFRIKRIYKDTWNVPNVFARKLAAEIFSIPNLKIRGS